jgi:hypothetical protein
MYSLAAVCMICLYHPHFVECILRNISYENYEIQKIRFTILLAHGNITEQSRETGNIGYIWHLTKTNKTKPHHYMPTMTNNVNKTSTLLHTTEGKDELNIVSMRKSYRTFDSKSAVSHRRSYFLLQLYKQPVYIQCYFTSLIRVKFELFFSIYFYKWRICITCCVMGRIWIMRQICVIFVCHEYGHVWVEELWVTMCHVQIAIMDSV